MWNLSRPGTEPVLPLLAGGFLSTVPPEVDFKEENTFSKHWQQSSSSIYRRESLFPEEVWILGTCKKFVTLNKL